MGFEVPNLNTLKYTYYTITIPAKLIIPDLPIAVSVRNNHTEAKLISKYSRLRWIPTYLPTYLPT